MLNAITGINCIQSVFPQSKLQQSKVKNKMITGTKNIETNKINKKQSKMNLTLMICYTQIKVLNVNILLTLISPSTFNTEKLM